MSRFVLFSTLCSLFILGVSCGKSGESPNVGSFYVQTIGSHSINGNSVVLEGALICSDVSEVSFGFYYGKKSVLSQKQVFADELDGNKSFYVTLNNIESSEEYSFCAFAKNGDGEKRGNVLSFSIGNSTEGNGGRGPVATSFASGDGSADNPYIIADASHLRFLSDECARGKTFRGDHLLVIKDIVINSDLIVSGQLNSSSQKELWYPINGFQGTFDGGNHVISGLYADSSELQELFSEEVNGIGLFGVSAGLIKNVRVEDSYFSSLTGSSVGGIIGEHKREQESTVEHAIINCHFSGIIDGGFRYKTGGIAGANDVGKAIDCSFSGIITGAMGGGSGIVGRAASGGTIINCVNYGKISGYYCCGILGQGINGRVTISNCINAGEIHYYNPVSANEGLVYLVGIFIGGANATLNNNINYGVISGPEDRIGAIFGTTFDHSYTINGENYYLETSAKLKSINNAGSIKLGTSMTEKEMKNPAFLSQLNSAARSLDGACSWKFGEDGFPTLNWVE